MNLLEAGEHSEKGGNFKQINVKSKHGRTFTEKNDFFEICKQYFEGFLTVKEQRSPPGKVVRFFKRIYLNITEDEGEKALKKLKAEKSA